MEAEIDAAVAAHPGIIRKFSIGQSYEGRPIWAVKISDRVGKDESEPEILFEAGTTRASTSPWRWRSTASAAHANYSTAPVRPAARRNIVNRREIFIVPLVNVDGAEYDIDGGAFHLRGARTGSRFPAPRP